MVRKILAHAVVVGVSIAVSACGGGGSDSSSSDTSPVTLSYTINGEKHTEQHLGFVAGSGQTISIVTSAPITTGVQDVTTSGLCTGGADASSQTYTFTYTGYCSRTITITTSAGPFELGVTVGNASTAIGAGTSGGTTTGGGSTGTATGSGSGTVLPAGAIASDGSVSLGDGLCRRPVTDAEWAALGGAAATGSARPIRTYLCP